MPKPNSVATSALHQNGQHQDVTARADQFVASLRRLIAKGARKWHAPTIAHDEDEDAVEISWWRADKSLIITIEPDSPITYLKAWGPNIHSDMEEGENPSAERLIELWQWLYA
jgi:hypothetical protein